MKAIVRLKSFPNHQGIPGHQGGSLPKNGPNIDKEIAIISDELNKHKDTFESAYIVGSWAAMDPRRMPDRHGPKTSDIDLMLQEKWKLHGNSIMEAWDVAAKLEPMLTKKLGRPVHLNVAPVSGGNPSKKIWSNNV